MLPTPPREPLRRGRSSACGHVPVHHHRPPDGFTRPAPRTLTVNRWPSAARTTRPRVITDLCVPARGRLWKRRHPTLTTTAGSVSILDLHASIEHAVRRQKLKRSKPRPCGHLSAFPTHHTPAFRTAGPRMRLANDTTREYALTTTPEMRRYLLTRLLRISLQYRRHSPARRRPRR